MRHDMQTGCPQGALASAGLHVSRWVWHGLSSRRFGRRVGAIGRVATRRSGRVGGMFGAHYKKVAYVRHCLAFSSGYVFFCRETPMQGVMFPRNHASDGTVGWLSAATVRGYALGLRLDAPGRGNVPIRGIGS